VKSPEVVKETNMPEGSTIESALRGTAISWKRFLAAVDSVPADRVEESGVSGGWSVKTIIGHVSFWDGVEADRIGKVRPIEDVDFQALNDQNALASGERTFAELRAELEINHARVLEAIVLAHTVSPDEVRQWLDDHYIEHGNDIEAWLARGL
jgi:hypothetical protein